MSAVWFSPERLKLLEPALNAYIRDICAITSENEVDRYGCVCSFLAFATASNEQFIRDGNTLHLRYIPGTRTLSINKYLEEVRGDLVVQDGLVRSSPTYLPPLLRSLNHFFTVGGARHCAQDMANIEEVILGLLVYFGTALLDDTQIQRRLALDATRFLTVEYTEQRLRNLILLHRDQATSFTLARLAAMASSLEDAVAIVGSIGGVRVTDEDTAWHPTYETYELPDTPAVGVSELYAFDDPASLLLL